MLIEGMRKGSGNQNTKNLFYICKQVRIFTLHQAQFTCFKKCNEIDVVILEIALPKGVYLFEVSFINYKSMRAIKSILVFIPYGND